MLPLITFLLTILGNRPKLLISEGGGGGGGELLVY